MWDCFRDLQFHCFITILYTAATTNLKLIFIRKLTFVVQLIHLLTFSNRDNSDWTLQYCHLYTEEWRKLINVARRNSNSFLAFWISNKTVTETFECETLSQSHYLLFLYSGPLVSKEVPGQVAPNIVPGHGTERYIGVLFPDSTAFSETPVQESETSVYVIVFSK